MENPPTNMINAGCYIFNHDVIESIPEGVVISVERETFPGLLNNDGRLFGFVDSNYWLDIGNPGALLKATSDLISGVASSSAVDEALAAGRIFRRDLTLLHGENVVFEQPSTQDSGCFIGSGAVIGSQSTLSRCVVGENAIIGEKVVLINTFVAPGFHVPAATLAENAFLGFTR
jgi:mannose-1-phosphate guanylyltransferase